jgi:hypothetical protein
MHFLGGYDGTLFKEGCVGLTLGTGIRGGEVPSA